MSVTLLLVPLLLLRHTRPAAKTDKVDAATAAADIAARASGSQVSRSLSSPRLVADAVASDPSVVTLPAEPDASTSTSMAPTTTTRPRTAVTAKATTTTTVRRTTTTTTAPRPTTTTTAPPAHTQTGQASWYDAPAGTCAHPSAPMGTIITVTDLDNGRQTKCRVADRGPYSGGRILDMSKDTFANLADPSAGVIDVRIIWS